MANEGYQRPITWLPETLEAIGYNLESDFTWRQFCGSLTLAEREGKMRDFVRAKKITAVSDIDTDGFGGRRYRTLKYDGTEYHIDVFGDGIMVESDKWYRLDEAEKRRHQIQIAKDLLDMYYFKNEVEFKSVLDNDTTITTQVVPAGERVDTTDFIVNTGTKYLSQLVNKTNLYAIVPKLVAEALMARVDFPKTFDSRYTVGGSGTPMENWIKMVMFNNMVERVIIADTPDNSKESTGDNVWGSYKNVVIQHRDSNSTLGNKDGLTHLQWSKFASPTFMEKEVPDNNEHSTLGYYKQWMDASYGFVVGNPKNILILEGIIA